MPSIWSSWLDKAIGIFFYNRFTRMTYEWFLWNRIRKGDMPSHIGVILDGNRRWALSKGLPPERGHSFGARKAEVFIEWCAALKKIKTVTLYVLSTENFQRSNDEVDSLMQLLRSYLSALITDQRIHRNRIRVKIIGSVEMLPEDLRDCIRRLEEATQAYDNFYLNLAVAYGGRTEILDAIRQIAVDIEAGVLSSKDVNEDVVENRLYTRFLPNPHPDLVIRTSGEERLSNFLLWQSAYSEFIFLEAFWPSFRKIDLMRAIRVYQDRHRRYGS